MNGLGFNSAFPSLREAFGWPFYTEVQQIRVTWVVRALQAFGWTIHDVIDRREVKEFLAAAWKEWQVIERAETRRCEGIWKEYLAWVAEMVGEAPARARVA